MGRGLAGAAQHFDEEERVAVDPDVFTSRVWHQTLGTDQLERAVRGGAASLGGFSAKARVIGSGPRYRALVVQIDDTSTMTRGQSRHLRHVLATAIEAQLPSLVPVSQVLLVGHADEACRVSRTHLSMIRGVLGRVRSHGLNRCGMEVSANAVILPMSFSEDRTERTLADLLGRSPLQVTGVVVDSHEQSADVPDLRSSLMSAFL